MILAPNSSCDTLHSYILPVMHLNEKYENNLNVPWSISPCFSKIRVSHIGIKFSISRAAPQHLNSIRNYILKTTYSVGRSECIVLQQFCEKWNVKSEMWFMNWCSLIIVEISRCAPRLDSFWQTGYQWAPKRRNYCEVHNEIYAERNIHHAHKNLRNSTSK